jgi:nitrilase
MRVAIFQADSLPIDKTNLNYYLSIARRERAKLVIFPEYALNRFFFELQSTPLNFLKKQTQKQIEILKRNSQNLAILAPLVIIKGDKIYKALLKFHNEKIRYYYQQIYMPYSHWNEDKFFSKRESKPMIFTIDNIRIGAIFGFEAHFEKFWEYFREKNVDLVAVSSVGTFNSFDRWYCMLKSKAFLNSMYVARANRVGEWNDWKFYGRSFAFSPFSDEIMLLGSDEEIGIFDVDKEKVKEARREWKFKKLSSLINF